MGNIAKSAVCKCGQQQTMHHNSRHKFINMIRGRFAIIPQDGRQHTHTHTHTQLSDGDYSDYLHSTREIN